MSLRSYRTHLLVLSIVLTCSILLSHALPRSDPATLAAAAGAPPSAGKGAPIIQRSQFHTVNPRTGQEELRLPTKNTPRFAKMTPEAAAAAENAMQHVAVASKLAVHSSVAAGAASPPLSSSELPHSSSVSSPGQSESESAVRLLLHQESHMADTAPRLLFGLIRFILYTILLLVFALWWLQGTLLYMPTFGRAGETKPMVHNSKGFRSPTEYGLQYEDCWIRNDEDGAMTHGWLILQPNSAAAPTIIFFHGNAGNIGYRLPNARSLYMTTGSNILLVDYRGYGFSEGEPSELCIKSDARAVLKWLRSERLANNRLGGGVTKPEIDLSRLYLFGRSLGGAVAIACALEDQRSHDDTAIVGRSSASSYPPLAGIMVENTFCTLVDMVLVLGSRVGIVPHERGQMQFQSIHARLWRRYLDWLMISRWKSVDDLRYIRTPALFISGLADELIPPIHMSGLFAQAQSCHTKHIHTVESGTHNDTFVRGGIEYWQAIADFIERTTDGASSSSSSTA